MKKFLKKVIAFAFTAHLSNLITKFFSMVCECILK